MSASLDQSRSQQLHAAAELADRVGGESTERFLRRYYRHVATEDLARARPRGPARCRAVAPAGSPPNRPEGTANVRVFTPTVERARLVLRPHRRRGRHRRHAVPRRLGDHRARPRRAATSTWSSTRSSSSAATSPASCSEIARRRRDRRAPSAAGDASASRGCTSRSTARPTPRRPRARSSAALREVLARRPGGGRGLAEDAGRGARASPTSSTSRPPAGCRAEEVARGRGCCAGWPTTTSPSSATASTRLRARRRRRRAARRCRAPGSGILRYDQAELGLVRPAAAEARAKAREQTAADPHQGQLPRHRAPPAYLDYVGVKTFDDERRGHRRAPLPRPVHLRGLHRVACTRIPVLRARSTRSSSAPGFAADEPRRQGPAARSSRPTRATSCSRSTVDELCRHRDRGAAPAGAPPGPAVPAPGRLRPLRLLPGLPAARPLHHRRCGCGSRRSCRSAFGGESRRLHRPGLRVGAGPAALRRARRRRASRSPTSTPAELERAARRGHPLLGRRPRRGRSHASTARRRAPQLAAPYGDAFPEAYKEDFPAAHRRRPTSAASRRSRPTRRARR